MSRLNPFARGHALLRSLRRRDENAIDDAVGVRLTEMTLDSETVYRA
jgi:hypothetical protein